MTLVIALNCKDGIIMASDGQTTVGSSGGPVRVVAEKIFKVNNTTLFGASGNVGNIQKSLEIIRNIKDLEQDWTSVIMNNVKQQLFPAYYNDLQRHVNFYRNLNPNQIPPPPIADIILAKMQDDGKGIIWHIAPDCSDELLQELGYACTGNGDIFAHTLLKGYEIREIEVEKAKLLAYNTIKLGIEVGAYGLGEPIYICTIKKKECGIEVEKVKEEEIMALKDACYSWREAQRELFDKIQVEFFDK
jgi:20S proteasome alpha/beta subunit